jgi:hypothetical protein
VVVSLPSSPENVKWPEKEKDNAGTQRFRRKEDNAGRRCKLMFTVNYTATLDNLSRYFLSSNNSNGVRVERNSIRGMGMEGNMVRENGVCGRDG